MNAAGPTCGKIVGHLWRPATVPTYLKPGPPWADRGCAYLGCDRPRFEHARSVNNPTWGSRRLL